MNKTVLVVEDVALNIKVVKTVLTKAGFDVMTAITAEEALELVAKARPHLILADIRLPGMDGLEMTRQLKANPQTADIPIVALTAFAMPGDEQKALEAGCDGYVIKPINVRTFPDLVRGYLKSRTPFSP